jgi:8-oxo-dGTP diphosphatase
MNPADMASASPIDWTTWNGEMRATILFVVKHGQVLLIEKKRGLGAGKINGPGGKIDPGETALQAAIRETQEELLVTPLDPIKLGELQFSMSDCPDIHCHVYRSNDFTGIPTETEEAVPVWASVDAIPYHRMWEDDRHWLPLLLNNQTFLGRFIFESDKLQWSEVVTGVVW